MESRCAVCSLLYALDPAPLPGLARS